MNIDPVLVDLFKGYLAPILITAVALVGFAMQQRTNTALIVGMISVNVRKGLYDANDLLEIGLLDTANFHPLSGAELLKSVLGGVK